MTLTGRKVLLGITGGIAAYKAPLLLRELQRRGADVRVVMTPNAQQFVAPRPLAVLSRHLVHTDMWGSDPDFPVLHVGLAQWADLLLVAPASAAMCRTAAFQDAGDPSTSGSVMSLRFRSSHRKRP